MSKSPSPTGPAASNGPLALRTFVLILQHPQEKAEPLATVPLLASQLKNATLRIGLSWPNLTAALGEAVEPRRWGVLYLGSAKPMAKDQGPLIAVDKQGEPVGDQERAFAGLEGLILLDGSWSEAKSMWWRNPWLLKCRRLVLNPAAPSRYGALRHEPRRESLSTIEAAAMALEALEHDPGLGERLLLPFEQMLAAYRAVHGARAKPRAKAGYRPRRKTAVRKKPL